jgi:hypothetical protein
MNNKFSKIEITQNLVNEYLKTEDKWVFTMQLLAGYELDYSDETIEELECILESVEISNLTK